MRCECSCSDVFLMVNTQTDRAFEALVLLFHFRSASSRQRHNGKPWGSVQPQHLYIFTGNEITQQNT